MKQYAIVRIQVSSHISYVSREIHTRQYHCSALTTFRCQCDSVYIMRRTHRSSVKPLTATTQSRLHCPSDGWQFHSLHNAVASLPWRRQLAAGDIWVTFVLPVGVLTDSEVVSRWILPYGCVVPAAGRKSVPDSLLWISSSNDGKNSSTPS